MGVFGKDVHLCVVSPGGQTGTSVVGCHIRVGSGRSARVSLENLVELPLSKVLVAVGVVSRGQSSEGLDLHREIDCIFGRVDKHYSAIHLGRYGELGHDDPGHHSVVVVLPVEQNTSHIAPSSKSVVAARIAASVGLGKESCRHLSCAVEESVSVGIDRWDLEDKTGDISSVEGQEHVQVVEGARNGVTIRGRTSNDPPEGPGGST